MDFSTSLRSAGDGLSRVKNKVATAARGLRMPGVGTAVPVAPAAAAASLPVIDPAMASRPAVTAAAPAASMRAPVAPIPTLTDVLQPGMGPNKPVPQIPTLTDVHTPGVRPASAAAVVNPNVGAGAMSAERAAFDAARTSPAAPAAAPAAATGMRSAMNVLGKAGAAGAVGMGVYDAATGVMEGDMKKAGLGAADAAAGASLLTPAAPIGATWLGARAGAGMVNAALSDSAKDAIGGTINAGLRRADDILGTHWGVDDSDLLAQRAAQPATNTAAQSAVPVAAPAEDDIAAFNARMAKVGAPTMSMRATADGGRELFNTQPASAEAQRATEQNMGMRSGQLAAAEAGYARAEERRQADIKMQTLADRQFSDTGQGAALAAQMDQARQPRIGASPVAPAAVIAAQQVQAQKDFETTKGLRMQGAVAMRGQDTTANDARLAQQTAQANGMRAQIAADRAYGLDVNKQRFDQDKALTEERAKAEKGFAEHLGTIFVDKDGKPDAVRVADATKKIQDELGERIRQAQAVPKDSPNYAAAQNIATMLSKQGLAALDPEDRQLLISQLSVRDRVKQQHGVFTPGSASFVDSRLGDYAVETTNKNLIGSDTLTLRNGGSVRANDVRFTEPGNPFFNGMKVPTTDFEAGLGMRKGSK